MCLSPQKWVKERFRYEGEEYVVQYASDFAAVLRGFFADRQVPFSQQSLQPRYAVRPRVKCLSIFASG